jgi:hypothetical protein
MGWNGTEFILTRIARTLLACYRMLWLLRGARMKYDRIPNDLIGAAGVHYVAFELSRRGMIALPTIRNTAGYDIIATTPDGKRHANLQVKTVLRKPGFWPVGKLEQIRTGDNDYYVFVRNVGPAQSGVPEVFILTGKEVAEQL